MCESDVSDPPTASPTPSAPPAAPGSAGTPPSPHATSTTERGSFCLARCVCGWSGPARRSRDLARTDAAAHALNP
ncbi:hypothetical protein [Streptomyces sp. 150FB]|uniref:hypothetical protein n=1 Tax=Streptomyces sp. 150FB TaxID=1576605 RepID=UPI00099D6DD0|nr:hypothetical protein [Streptomyces sp. 150FB]